MKSKNALRRACAILDRNNIAYKIDNKNNAITVKRGMDDKASIQNIMVLEQDTLVFATTKPKVGTVDVQSLSNTNSCIPMGSFHAINIDEGQGLAFKSCLFLDGLDDIPEKVFMRHMTLGFNMIDLMSEDLWSKTGSDTDYFSMYI